MLNHDTFPSGPSSLLAHHLNESPSSAFSPPVRMTLALNAMPQLDTLEGTRRIPEMDPTENEGTGRKRRRTRKVQTDRKFDCTFENCGKRYSRAEHLYRHQLNRTCIQLDR